MKIRLLIFYINVILSSWAVNGLSIVWWVVILKDGFQSLMTNFYAWSVHALATEVVIPVLQPKPVYII